MNLETRGELFKEAREMKRLSLTEASKKAGVSASLISDLERDVDRKFNADDLVKLAKLYGVSTDYLFGITTVKTIEPTIRAICEYTGLSEIAIDTISNFSETAKTALDLLLSFDDISLFFAFTHAHIFYMDQDTVPKAYYDFVLSRAFAQILETLRNNGKNEVDRPHWSDEYTRNVLSWLYSQSKIIDTVEREIQNGKENSVRLDKLDKIFRKLDLNSDNGGSK